MILWSEVFLNQLSNLVPDCNWNPHLISTAVSVCDIYILNPFAFSKHFLSDPDPQRDMGLIAHQARSLRSLEVLEPDSKITSG